MNASAGNPALVNIPDLQQFAELAGRVFASGRLTNNGDLARELEQRLARYLGVPYLALTSSGTLALQIAYQALQLTGDVLTTPFSWTTTVSSLTWLGLRPRFADIDPRTFNIDPRQIEAQLTPGTSAILAVHAFGNPCEIDAIEAIAARHGLLTVYDAAHAFGARYRDRSVFSQGDASVLSLNATKLFHTVEGGAVILRSRDAYERACMAVNNGMDAGGQIRLAGVNGRLSELHAAVGLCLFDSVDSVLSHRARIANALRIQLGASSAVELQSLNPLAQANHAYFPVVFPTPQECARAITALAQQGFATRRYFDFPLNRLPFVEDRIPMPVAESLSERIVCLLLRFDASLTEAETIGRIVGSVCPTVARLSAAA